MRKSLPAFVAFGVCFISSFAFVLPGVQHFISQCGEHSTAELGGKPIIDPH